MTSIEVLEQRIEALRAQVRRALMTGERELAMSLRRKLRQAEREWDDALDHLTQDRSRDDTAPPKAPEAGQPAFSEASAGAEASGTGELGAPAGSHPGGTGARPGSPPGTLPGRGYHAGAEPVHRTAEGTANGAGAGAGSGRAPGPAEDRPPGNLVLPLREQVHQALTLLSVPAAPKLISAAHEAFFAGAIFGARLTSLRRDEERSFRTAPFARPYYVCAALTADLLAPARGLLALSTWPMERRVIGPLSPRVDFLTAAIQVAEAIQRIPDPGPGALRLLWRFGSNIPGGATRTGRVDAPTVAEAARAERGVHADADTVTRREAAQRARRQLDDVQQLFGTRLGVTGRTGTAP